MSRRTRTFHKFGSVQPRPTREPTRATTKKRPQWKELVPTNEDSFTFSYELGLGILQQGQLWTPLVLGGWKRLLNNLTTSSQRLDFIEACAALRASLVGCGSFVAAAVKAPGIRYMRGLISSIQHSIDVQLCVHPSQEFNQLACFLGWLKRLPVDIRPDEVALEDYFENDRRLSKVTYEDNTYMSGLEEIWREWFGGFRLTAPLGAFHSSGSTSDAGNVRHEKWKRTGAPRAAKLFLHGDDLQSLVEDLPIAKEEPAKVVIVPKAAGKGRTICMEPASMQFLQHGVAVQLIDYCSTDRHPLSKLVTITDQENNRALCASAWQEGLATIDLSDASDSVSWRLVRALTARLALGRYLSATRSRWTSIGGYLCQFDKYAPMGSALCFPIECYVFASVVELAYRIHSGKTGAGRRIGCSVYGDDIIVPRGLYHLVVEILTSLGFKVNEAKSFSSGPYYESCGVEYLYGVAIKTVRHPRCHLVTTGVVSPERVSMVADLANSMLHLGLLKARRMLLKHYMGVLVHVDGRPDVPFRSLVTWDENGIIPLRETPPQTEFDAALQCRVVKRPVVRPTMSSAPSDWDEASSRMRRRDRRQRLSELYPRLQRVEIREELTVKGVLCLAKFGCFDLIQQGEVEETGNTRTGRLRYRYRVASIPYREK